jgi:hypothetical protein
MSFSSESADSKALHDASSFVTDGESSPIPLSSKGSITHSKWVKKAEEKKFKNQQSAGTTVSSPPPNDSKSTSKNQKQKSKNMKKTKKFKKRGGKRDGAQALTGALVDAIQKEQGEQICRQFRDNGTCTFGERCRFVHRGSDIVEDPIPEPALPQVPCEGNGWAPVVAPPIIIQSNDGEMPEDDSKTNVGLQSTGLSSTFYSPLPTWQIFPRYRKIVWKRLGHSPQVDRDVRILNHQPVPITYSDSSKAYYEVKYEEKLSVPSPFMVAFSVYEAFKTNFIHDSVILSCFAGLSTFGNNFIINYLRTKFPGSAKFMLFMKWYNIARGISLWFSLIKLCLSFYYRYIRAPIVKEAESRKYETEDLDYTLSSKTEIRTISEELAVQLLGAGVNLHSTLDSQAAIVDRLASNFPQINLDRRELRIKEDTKLYAKQFFLSNKERDIEAQLFQKAPQTTDLGNMDTILLKSVNSRISRSSQEHLSAESVSKIVRDVLSSRAVSVARLWGRRFLMLILSMLSLKYVVLESEWGVMYQVVKLILFGG